MGTDRRNLLILSFSLFFLQANLAAFADASFEIALACKSNLKMLREGLSNYINEGSKDLPTWDTFEHVFNMALTSKYIPKKPVPPTLDCKYFLVYKSPEIFDWYCSIHGVISGDKSITFRYHEFEFKGIISSKYLGVPQYKTHADELERWIGYSPTLVESIKFNFEKNPTSTLIKVGLGLIFLIFIYKKIFGN
ncbi:hypothetical protein HYY75_00880 [bacterium]|nr:hypothetical protein [bacterium]